MKRFYVLLALAIGFMSFKSDVTLDQVIKTMLQTRGKMETLSAIKDQVQVWTMTDPKKNTCKLIINFKRPNKFKMEIKSVDGKTPLITSTYDGKSGTQVVFGKSRKMTQEELNEHDIKTLTFIDGLNDWEKKGFSLKLLPDVNLNGVNYHVLQSMDKYKNVQKIYCNAKTGGSEIIEFSEVDIMSLKKVTNKSVIQSPKNYNGLLYASKILLYDKDNKLVATMNLEKVSNNTGITDKEFIVK
jgi:outer membrane lipoprotein-sorting protein